MTGLLTHLQWVFNLLFKGNFQRYFMTCENSYRRKKQPFYCYRNSDINRELEVKKCNNFTYVKKNIWTSLT